MPSTQYICFFYVVLPIFASSSSSSRLLCCCCLQFQFQRFDSLIVCAKVGASGQDHQSMILICCSLLLVWARAFFFKLTLKSQRRPSLAKHRESVLRIWYRRESEDNPLFTGCADLADEDLSPIISVSYSCLIRGVFQLPRSSSFRLCCLLMVRTLR